MVEPTRLLVVTQPILGPISTVDVERAIPAAKRRGGWDMLTIDPLRASLGELSSLDWAEAVAAQERLFEERLRADLPRRSRLAYFGFAPIPLAVDLGYRVERTRAIDVYQRHHRREDWCWSPAPPEASRARLQPLSLPERGSDAAGPLVIRVSTSHGIDPRLTSEVVPRALAQVDVALAEPNEDALATPDLLGEVVQAFNQALATLNRLFPNATDVHLFMAVPVGLAFRIGTQINPTIYPPVVTYQFQAKAQPRYRAAVVLADGLALASGPFVDPSPAAASRSSVRPLLAFQEMLEVWEAAIQGGLAAERSALLVGVDRSLAASLPSASRPDAQFLLDLDGLRRSGWARDGSAPLARWLEVAHALTRGRPEAGVFAAALATLLERRG